MTTVLFFKARIPGGAMADLFATPVTVSGYVNQEGTFVAPHMAIRHKAPEAAAAPAAAPELIERAKYGDGRLIPQLGDKVFQAVPGPFGMPATIYGEVVKGAGGTRVKTTGSSSLIGAAKTGKTYPVDGTWTVVGDPELQRRKDAREAKEAEAKAAHQAEIDAHNAKMDKHAAERGDLRAEDVQLGDVIEGPDGERQVVAQIWDGGIYATPVDDLDEGARSFDTRGWRKIDAEPPEGARIEDTERAGAGKWKQRIGGQWIPVEWDDDAQEYRPVAVEAPAVEPPAPPPAEPEAADSTAAIRAEIDRLTEGARAAAARMPWAHIKDVDKRMEAQRGAFTQEIAKRAPQIERLKRKLARLKSGQSSESEAPAVWTKNPGGDANSPTGHTLTIGPYAFQVDRNVGPAGGGVLANHLYIEKPPDQRGKWAGDPGIWTQQANRAEMERSVRENIAGGHAEWARKAPAAPVAEVAPESPHKEPAAGDVIEWHYKKTGRPRWVRGVVSESRKWDGTLDFVSKESSPRSDVRPGHLMRARISDVKVIHRPSEAATKPDIFAETRAQMARVTAEAAALAASGKPVRLLHPGGRGALAGPDVSKPGMFRLTTIDADGPVGHVEFDTLEAAIKDALLHGFEAAPKEGDRKTEDGVEYVLRDGRWHRATPDAEPVADLPLVEHVTRKGKTLRGVIRTDLTEAQAKAIDEYTFKKDGGWFIRERYLSPDDVAATGAESAQVAPAPAAPPPPQDVHPAPAAGVQPLKWGVPAGIKPAARKRLNAEAVALLNTKTDAQMTEADKAVLAQYSGTGGVGDSLNEFYTPPDVATAMWSLLANAGFAGGDVLEPSSGTGVFLHTAPRDAFVQAVELDPIAARIAGILHRPSLRHDVRNASLERFATQDGRQFDAVIGNVPFGPRGSLIRDDKPDLATAETYFVDTALDKTRDGGLVALIVPTGIMDSRNGRGFRERMLRKAEFLGAHRMPNTAFEASHTDVTTDVILLRKRPQDVAGALSTVSQVKLAELGVWDEAFLAGAYFTDRGAANVYGKVGTAMRAFGEIYTVNGAMDGVASAIGAWRPDSAAMAPNSPSVPRILEALEDDPAAVRRAYNAALKPPYQVSKVGDVKVMDGVRYVLEGEPPRWHRADADIPEAVEDAQKLGNLLADLEAGKTDAYRDHARAKLIEALDEYVRDHGIPLRNKELLAWIAAPRLPVRPEDDEAAHGERTREAHRSAARVLGMVSESGRYSDFVTGHKREGEAAGVDAQAVSLALEAGGFTVEQLADAAGMTPDAVLDHLFASPDYAVEADGKTWTTADSYLSGELWPKYDAAREAAAREGVEPYYRDRYMNQAAALLAAIGPQSLEDVEVAINSGFITPEVISAWFTARQDAYMAENPGATWCPSRVTVKFEGGVWSFLKAQKEDKADLPPAATLLEDWLNRTGVKKDDKDLIDKHNRDFREWLLGSEYRDAVEERYNRTYRGFIPKVYSDAPIDIPGLNPALDVHGFHFAGIRWAMEAGSGIIAADVGLGKTGRGLMLARLAKATGEVKKPTFVVPKSVMANWVAEAEFWFPGSSVLTIGETYSRDKAGNVVSRADDEATRRQKFHQLQQNDYDFVFISQPTWNDLDLDPITKGEYINSDFWVQRGDALGNAGSKRINRIREKYDQAVARRDFADREGTIYFNQLGIDMLIMDEGHAYKNLYTARNRWGESPKFLGGSGESNRALDTALKTRALRDAHGGRGVFMLTATPTKNSPLEIYSMLTHIAPEAFARLGIRNSEDFIDRFCEFTNDRVLTTSGEVETALVTSGFKNLGELREVMRRYIDRKTAQDVGLYIPEGEVHDHMVDMTPEQEAVYQGLRKKLAERDSKNDADGSGHVFSIMDRMGKASLDLELLGKGTSGGSRSPKIDACADNVIKLAPNGGQLIFCDSVPTHETIKAALVAKGMKAERIGIINAGAAESSAARQRVTELFNAGKLDAVIGNTATMGEGLNMQKRTSDIHHLDLPWEPASVQQRNGRARRQGNKREKIGIHTYLAKRSFDGYRWQTIRAKRNWQDLLWNGGDRVENLAREGAFSRDDMLIMMSADPDGERAKLEADKSLAEKRYKALARGEAVDQFVKLKDMRRSLAELHAKGSQSQAVARLEQRVSTMRDALEANPHFSHKHLLDDATPVLIEPMTDVAYRPGVAFEVHPGPEAPVNWSRTESSKWIVTGLDMDHGNVVAREYGEVGGRPLTIKVDDLKSGVTPFTYDKAKETEEIGARIRAAAEADAVAGRKGIAESVDIGAYKKLPPSVVAELAPTLQEQMKSAVRGYNEKGHRTHWGMIDAEGEPKLVENYDVRDKIDTHDFLLPTEEGRLAAIDGYVRDALASDIGTYYPTSTRRRGGYSSPPPTGMQRRYPGKYGLTGGYANPWISVINEVMGPDTVTAAQAALTEAVHKNIAEAPTMRAAMEAALPSIAIPHAGATKAQFPAPLVRALYEKARDLGVLDEQVFRAINVHPASGRNVTVGHSLLYQVDNTNFGLGAESKEFTQHTVGEYLKRLMPDRGRSYETKEAA